MSSPSSSLELCFFLFVARPNRAYWPIPDSRKRINNSRLTHGLDNIQRHKEYGQNGGYTFFRPLLSFKSMISSSLSSDKVCQQSHINQSKISFIQNVNHNCPNVEKVRFLGRAQTICHNRLKHRAWSELFNVWDKTSNIIFNIVFCVFYLFLS